jgi:hypothetical protein
LPGRLQTQCHSSTPPPAHSQARPMKVAALRVLRPQQAS